MQESLLLASIKPRLAKAFGKRLHAVLAYGSRVRGETSQHSDLDLMVTLEKPVRLGEDLYIIIEALYPLQLQVEYPIDAMPVEVGDFEAAEFGIYRNAKREGVFLRTPKRQTCGMVRCGHTRPPAT